jgi:peptidyl-prolyl cis-trans isomerase C
MNSRRRDEMRLHFREIVLVLLSLGLLSCSSTGERSSQQTAASPVIARANESVLTLADLENMIPPEYREHYGLEDRKTLINSWIETELVYQEAVRQGIDNEPELQAKVDEFQRLLLENEILQRELGIRVKVTDAEIEKYYHDNSDFFLREKEEVRISQIVVDSLGLAGELREQLRNNPTEFSRLAGEYSLDKSGNSDGDVGYYAVDELIEPLSKAVMSLNVGEMSPVVSVSGYGHFIVMVTDRKGSGTMKALEDVEDEIKDILLINKEEEERRKWVDALMSRNEVEINWQLVEERYGDQ